MESEQESKEKKKEPEQELKKGPGVYRSFLFKIRRLRKKHPSTYNLVITTIALIIAFSLVKWHLYTIGSSKS